MTRDVKIFLSDETATDSFGALLANTLAPGDVLFLSGGLGAGKSSLARAIIQSRMLKYNTQEDVPSPTYTLVQQYSLPDCDIWHADLYRLSDGSECDELGLLDAFESDICLIEWPDVLGDLKPAKRIEITLDIPSDQIGRNLNMHAIGNWDHLDWQQISGYSIDEKYENA